MVPIVADENGIVLKGHATLAAAKLLNVQAVPTLTVSGLSEAQKRAFMIADNRVAEDAGWDRREILSVEFGELAELLRPVDLDLTVTGFETSEIDLIFPDRGAAKPDPADAVPLIPKDVVTHPGKLWCLGDHRLIFGDARSAADLDKLMAGACARLVFTDPPDNSPLPATSKAAGAQNIVSLPTPSGK